MIEAPSVSTRPRSPSPRPAQRSGLRLFASTLLAISLGAFACHKQPAEPAQKPAAAAPQQARVDVARATERIFSGRLPITGELKPIQEITLKSRVGGVVVFLGFDEGDVVKKGALIAKIDAGNQNAQLRGSQAAVSVASAQLDRSQADLERLKRDMQRIEMLHAQGAGDQKSLDDIRSAVKLATVGVQSATAQLDQSRASRDLARNAVGETKYVAPIAGVISRRGVSLHEYVDTIKSRDIVTIVDNSAMELVASVAADLASGLTKGAKVDFQVKSNINKIIEGEVSAVSPIVDSRSRTLRLRVRIPNPDGVLKGGMYATGHVNIGSERKGIAVPMVALRQELADDDSGEDADKQSVIWRIKNGVAERLVVRTGLSDGDAMEVLEGISPGDQIVISSPAKLKPGLPVAAQFHEPPAAPAAGTH